MPSLMSESSALGQLGGQVLDLGEFMQRIAGTQQRMIPSDVTLTIDRGPTDACVRLVPVNLERVMLNLIAMRATLSSAPAASTSVSACRRTIRSPWLCVIVVPDSMNPPACACLNPSSPPN